ncbi:MAG: lipopolysaccharide heptosyltransferase II [Deltaproteobacteria bacterium]|nr:lipopolysaccharide heptosyltransferase II [Deltaproteobacteria bacterium]MBW1919573.1 lipopolysaccharide heptosyltransferase II [Deltaproteobacteria bacterium]MBW2044836.1 lipopolysaccharide heptosyltransferase II [Deltaproteobacteria bacterium]RLB34744.1 MAG: lipopolysaccharide heptosyltransferase II [Deltaproteobacteria bacterium]
MNTSPQVSLDKSRIKRILIRAPNWVGDVVMSMPAVEMVRENFRSSSIAVLARPWVIPLYEAHPVVDQVLPFDKGNGYWGHFLEIRRAASLIRSLKFDLAILFQNAFEAAFLARLGGVKYRIGYKTDGRGFLLSHGVDRDGAILRQHQVEYYLHILRSMGWEAPSKDPLIYVDDTDLNKIASLLLSSGIREGEFLLGLGPGATYGPAKRWPVERFARIADWASQRWGARVVIVGSKGEQKICELLCHYMKQRPLNLCGETSLGEVIALIKKCDLFVCNDSGLMHVAASLDVPTIAIFGSTDPRITGPRGKKTRVIRHEMPCSPCLKPDCSIGYPCLLAIEPEHVWTEMQSLVKRKSSEKASSIY